MTFHFANERLTYLRRISKEFTSLEHSIKAYIFTNDAKQHTPIRRAIARPDLDIEILRPTPLRPFICLLGDIYAGPYISRSRIQRVVNLANFTTLARAINSSKPI